MLITFKLLLQLQITTTKMYFFDNVKTIQCNTKQLSLEIQTSFSKHNSLPEISGMKFWLGRDVTHHFLTISFVRTMPFFSDWGT